MGSRKTAAEAAAAAERKRAIVVVVEEGRRSDRQPTTTTRARRPSTSAVPASSPMLLVAAVAVRTSRWVQRRGPCPSPAGQAGQGRPSVGRPRPSSRHSQPASPPAGPRALRAAPSCGSGRPRPQAGSVRVGRPFSGRSTRHWRRRRSCPTEDARRSTRTARAGRGPTSRRSKARLRLPLLPVRSSSWACRPVALSERRRSEWGWGRRPAMSSACEVIVSVVIALRVGTGAAHLCAEGRQWLAREGGGSRYVRRPSAIRLLLLACCCSRPSTRESLGGGSLRERGGPARSPPSAPPARHDPPWQARCT